ncbi:sugar nucleotide-binding protein [Clostridium sp. CF011]|uniref:SDR family oxidoreductase n=1 Tax=Clostridium sp. CF011 TaxID=2843318 RepID=UPI001C0C3164|nr:sugar nucleotide-binding protein [Clostridium sp. CF011]MBU3092815.1 sugar nucleotide-binding protein [Clostridium sp. CF011]WAG70736.1 sugar nucleotide-binding protein [Clostridium sp. CF011]
MKKVLLTGSNGFLASRYYTYYKDKYEIIPLGHAELDITDESKALEIIQKFKPDYVIHTAAIADTGLCERNPELSYEINVKGSINIAKACSLSKSKLIYLSSEQIFNGNFESGPYNENHIPTPNTIYGKHKLEAENELKGIIDELWILRLTWLFGFPEKNCRVNSNILWNVVSSILKDKKMKLPSNEFRGMTYVYDIIANFDKIFTLPYGTYHTGSENNLSTYDIALLILKEIGLNHKAGNYLEKDTEKYKEHPRDLRISNSKLKNYDIVMPKTEDGIKKCLKDFNY